MFKIVFLILISSILSLANQDKRLIDLEKFLNTLPQKTTTQKLNSVNFYFNQIVSAYDSIDDINHDEWDTMIDFVLKGRGDCEEYAISKYEALKLSGIEKNKLFLMVVKEKIRPSNEFHLVTAYYEDDKNPLILDNLSFKALPLLRRTDLEPIMIFDDNVAYRVDSQGKKQEPITSPFPNILKNLEKKFHKQLVEKGITEPRLSHRE
ncbi:MAG: transglutaminase-like cysteine peptidase [Arcobacteraceae bacterium]|nr:transglutaminase-like cysteine peptidase [Arcobacteraceae bacterium]